MARSRSTTATGRVRGTTITLDAPVALPEGTVVRVVLEPLAGADQVLTPEAQAQAWREWVTHGPQGPLEAEDEAWPDDR